MDRIRAWLDEVRPDLKSQKSYRADIADFDLNTARSSNKGATDSKAAVGPGGFRYQLKKNINHARWYRRLKAAHTDRENIGEFIAATASSSILSGRVPHVALAHDEDRQELHIVSQWESENPENLGTKANLIDPNTSDKQKIADAIALSALNADHDINPENMIKVNGKIVRIDFGHAFNDLIRFRFPGGKKISQNRIIDYFNRETVNGFWSNGSKSSKLWYHYKDGLIPSEEMVKALEKIANRNIWPGLKAAQKELSDQIKNPKMQEQVMKALLSINKSIGGRKIEIEIRPENYEAILNTCFINLKQFYEKGAEDMKIAAKTMRLQLEIDQAIKTNDQKALEVTKNQQPTEYIKTNAKQKAFKGPMSEYIKKRLDFINNNK